MTARLTALLTAERVPFETFEHAPVRTSAQAAETRPGYTLRQGAKAILLRVKRNATDTFFVMLALPADRQFDKRKVKHLLSARDLRFATESEVSALTGGVEPGGVPPFGNLWGLAVLADRTLFENERIVFNAGDRRFSLAMPSADYRRIVQPQVVDLLG